MNEDSLRKALFDAIQSEDFAKVKECVRNGAKLNGEWKNDDGFTPLHVAILAKNEKVFHFLYQEPSCLTKTDVVGYFFPFHLQNLAQETEFYCLLLACSTGVLEIVKLLVDAGADVKKIDWIGKGPLLAASSKGHLEIAKILIDAGADVNKTNKYERGPLSQASSNGHVEIAKLLIDAGANVNETDWHGRGPLLEASSNGHVEIAKLLIDAGADLNKTDVHGRAPLLEASSNGHVEIAKLLIDAGAYATSPNLRKFLFDRWIRNRYDKLYSQGTTKPRKIKVCVIGKERAGKTTLIKTLRNIDWRDGGDDLRTASMDLSTANVDSAGELVFCDFAGQPFFYKTHGFFFSESTTIFLLLVDLTQSYDEMKDTSHYFCSFVKCSCVGFTGKSHVLVIGSKKDLLPDVTAVKANFRKLLHYLQITFGCFDFQNDYIILNCRDRESNELNLLKKAIGNVKELAVRAAKDVPVIVEAAVTSFLPILRNPSSAISLNDELCKITLSQMRNYGLISEKGKNRFMDVSVFKRLMADSIYRGLTEEVQTLLVEFLQGIGEIFFIGRKIILEPSWLCNNVIGPLLSPNEFPVSLQCPPPGTATKERIQRALEAFNHHKWENIDETIALLCHLEICHLLPDKHETYQFPALIQQERPCEVWCKDDRMSVYVGRRWKREEETDIITPGTMPFLQCRVRNTACFCGLEPVLWQGGLMIKKAIDGFSLEGMIILQEKDKALDFVVRGPDHSEPECMKLLTDLMRTGEKILREKSPGMERGLWYISRTELQKLKDSPLAYREEKVFDVMKILGKSSASLSEGTVEDSLKDLLALPDNHIDLLSHGTRCEIKECLEKDEGRLKFLIKSLPDLSPVDISKSKSPGRLLSVWSENLSATAHALAAAAQKANLLYILSLLNSDGAIKLSPKEKKAADQHLDDLLELSPEESAVSDNVEDSPGSLEDYLNKPVSSEERVKAAKRIQAKWKYIARILGPMPFDPNDLHTFKQKEDDRARAQSMLDTWSNKFGVKATRRHLINAMEAEDYKAQVCEIFPFWAKFDQM